MNPRGKPKPRILRMAIHLPAVFVNLVFTVLFTAAAPVTHSLKLAQQTQSEAGVRNSAAAPALPTFQFDVVSIKPLNSFTDPGGVTFEPNAIIARDISLWWLLRMAYGAQHGEVFQTPAWIDDLRFNFEARTDAETATAFQKLNNEQQTLARQQMLRAVLADRFKLTAHFEPRDLPAYLMTIATDGAKLEGSKPGVADPKALIDIHGNRLEGVVTFEMVGGSGATRIVMTGQSASVTELAAQLSRRTDHPVIDQTGLTGIYNFTVTCFVEDSLSGGGAGDASVANNPFTSKVFFKAVEKDLGLRLAAGKGSVNTLVIDHVERPSPD